MIANIFIVLISTITSSTTSTLQRLPEFDLSKADPDIFKNPHKYILQDMKYFVDQVTDLPYKELRMEVLNNGKIKQVKTETGDIKFELVFSNLEESTISDIKKHIPDDYKKNFNFGFIKNKKSKYLLKKLNKKWKELSKVNTNIGNKYSTLINTGIPYFVPGGRFKEFYYWDSYWTLLGLLRMKMYVSAENIVDNMAFMIRNYGFIPNGSRKYYLNRSQPPMFTQMLDLMLKFNPEKFTEKVLGEWLDLALKEYEWFKENRTFEFIINGEKVFLSQYNVKAEEPRLESFIYDFIIYKSLNDKKECQDQFYSHIYSAAESGWDFSTRWLEDDANLNSIKTKDFIPADLNAILYSNEVILSELLKQRGDNEESENFKQKSIQRSLYINKVLWNKEKNIWNDYNVKTKKFNDKRFFFSNIMPLIYGIKQPDDTSEFDIMELYIDELFGCVGGIPAGGKVDSDHQWDYPNAWAPHQSMMVEYLLKSNHRKLATQVARRFYENAYAAFKDNKCFYEKYNCTSLGHTGLKGEYEPQTGFGWTNGVLIDFIYQFDREFNEKFDHQKSLSEVKEYISAKGNH